tara:strand:- start:240 stop:386 length:147 start_codon:yes stop_codon:yes gene_type:complete
MNHLVATYIDLIQTLGFLALVSIAAFSVWQLRYKKDLIIKAKVRIEEE